MQAQIESSERFHQIGHVAHRYQASRSSIRRWVIAGKFPPPKIIGVNAQRWDEADLIKYDADPEAWVKHRRAA